MIGGGDENQEITLSKRREVLTGASGLKALIRNKKVFAIAVFASLGGFIYGYNQGMFGQILNMYSFGTAVHPNTIKNDTARGLLTAILELGAWVGALCNGVLADGLGRKLSVVVAVFVFCIGVIVQACATGPSYILGGRFVTGLGVGSLSMLVPLYNAELAPPEIRGGLVVLQQLAITFGIMVSYWIGYGTNFIGGTGPTQSKAAWLVPICIQLLPAIVLGIGIVFMPQSPRWLMNQEREQDCLNTIARLRDLPTSNELVTIEYLEIKAQHMFEIETSRELYPQHQGPGWKNKFQLGVHAYSSLFTNRSTRKRSFIAIMVMLFQQWTGINAILYYAPFIFQDLGLDGNTNSLLASGVGGILMFLATIPAVLWIDSFGRRPLLIIGAIGMAISHFVVAGILGQFENDFANHPAAGWVAVVFVWLFVLHFGYSWGGGAWVVISEVFSLGVRSKGVSIGASSNWLNNFIVGIATPTMLTQMKFGTYIFFGMFCVGGALFMYFVVPETRGRSLEEMDEIFKDESGMGRRDKERLQRIWGELGLLGESIPDLSMAKGDAIQIEETKQ
jgi:sugar porter (SP) family MFS transporter